MKAFSPMHGPSETRSLGGDPLHNWYVVSDLSWISSLYLPTVWENLSISEERTGYPKPKNIPKHLVK